MKPPLRSDIAAVLAACALTFTLNAQTQSDPATVVRELFVRYAAGDLRGASQLWAAGAPAEDFIRRHRSRLEKRCMRLESLTIDTVSEDPPIFDATSTMTLRTASAASPEWWESSRSRVTLKREGDEWRIASWELGEQELVDRLVLAADAADRASVLDSSVELKTTTFVRMAAQRAIDLFNQGRFDDAATLSEVAITIAERLGDPVSMSAGTNARSWAIRGRYQIDESLTLAEEAVSLADGAGNPDVLARALVSLTRARESANGIPDFEPVERAFALSPEIEQVSITAHAAVHLGRAHELRGRFREAFRFAELALRFAEESGDRAALTSASIFLHGVYVWIGDEQLVSVHRRRMVELALEGGFDGAAATGLTAMAMAAAGAGDIAGALRMLDKGLGKIKDRGAMGFLLQHRAAILRESDRFDEAERDLNYAATLAPTDASFHQELALEQTRLAIRRGNDEAALVHAAAARGPNLIFDRWARHHYAEMLVRLGRLHEARILLEELTAEGTGGPIIDLRRSLFDGPSQPSHRLLVEVLVAEGDTAAALRMAEAIKSKELSATLAHGKQATTTPPAEQLREQELEARARELNRQLLGGKLSGPPATAIRNQLTTVRADLVRLRRRLDVDGLAMPERSVEICIDDLPAHLDDVTIISYVVGIARTMILVLEPKRDGHRNVTVRTIALDRNALFAQTGHLAALIEQRNLRAPDVAAKMYDLLIGPIESSVRDARSLCIIPDVGLWRVPFQVLGPDGGPLLVDRVPLFYAPSIAVLAATRPGDGKPRAEKPRLLAFANPTVEAETASLYRAYDPEAPLGAIPETESEVRAIARIYGNETSRIYVGKTARETTLKKETSGFDVLHIATHGVVYESAPMFSSLLLTTSPDDEEEDGVLEAREIATLALDVDLTVLSACETGRASSSGSGVIGLSWAFLAAGCPTTVVSQWKAHSAASAILMVEFHRQLARGRSKPEALRRAQLALRRDRRYRHPFYWAPFMVIGRP